MNDAHLHIAINHFPLIGVFIGFGILIAAIAFRKTSLTNTAYVLFIVCAVAAYASDATGGPTAGMIKNLPDISRELIHEHAESAERLCFVLYGLGLISFIGLFLNRKKGPAGRYVTYIALILSAVGAYLSIDTGNTGGNVRHTEIRSDSGKPETKANDSVTNKNHDGLDANGEG